MENKICAEENRMLGLIVLAISTLDDKRGSSVIEVMTLISESSQHCQDNFEVFYDTSELFRKAFVYGVQIGVLVPDETVKRYSLTKTGPKVAQFLLSLDKKLHSSPRDEPDDPASLTEARPLEDEGSTSQDELDFGNVSPQLPARRDNNATDPRVFSWKDRSDSDSECEII